MSARLLKNETEEHKVGDDLESFVHVLTRVTIKYARNTLTPFERSRLLKKFDFTSYSAGKAEFFQPDLFAISPSLPVRIGLEQTPLSAVLEVIYSGFGHRYWSTRHHVLKETSKASAEAESEKLETHDWLHSVLQEALNNKEWKNARDGSVEQEIIRGV